MRYFTKVLIFAVLNIFLFAGLSHAEKVTFVKEYTYQASELDSKRVQVFLCFCIITFLFSEFGPNIR